MADLTTVASFQRHTGMSLADQGFKDQISSIITGVSDEVQRHCARDFEKKEHLLWLDGTGSRLLFLPEYPINIIYQMSINREVGAEITFAESLGTNANVDFDGTTLRLIDFDLTGKRNVNEVTITDAQTLTNVKTAVEAFTGWSMRIDANRLNFPSQMIRRFSGFAHGAHQADLVIPLDGEQSRVDVESERTVVRRDGVWPRGTDNVFFWFESGFVLPKDDNDGDIPPGLQMIVNQIVKDVFSASRENTVLKSERLADHAVVYDRGSITEVVQNRAKALEQYCKVHV